MGYMLTQCDKESFEFVCKRPGSFTALGDPLGLNTCKFCKVARIKLSRINLLIIEFIIIIGYLV